MAFFAPLPMTRQHFLQTAATCPAIVAGIALVALIASAGSLSAADLIPPSQAARLGLVEAWRGQMPVSAGAQSIVDQQLYVVEGQQVDYVEVTQVVGPAAAAAPVESPSASPTPATPETEAASEATTKPSPPDAKVFARFRVDGFGQGAGLEKGEAERRARQQVRILKRRGVEAEVTARSIPAVRLYTLGNDGSLQCQDAETGEIIWMTRVGFRNRGYGELGIDDEVIAIVNGSDLIQLDASTGNVIETVQMVSVPLFGAVQAGDYALVPTLRGGIECYRLKDTTVDPFMELVGGNALAMPSKSPGSDMVAWGTDHGFVYFAELSGTPSVLFRLNTDGNVTGKIAAVGGERFFFGSDGGQVYGVRATRTGEVLWSKPFGEAFYNEPLVYGSTVLLRSTYGSLFALDINNGNQVWDDSLAGVDELIACFNDRVYVRMLSGVLAVIDLPTGKIIEIATSVLPRTLLTNYQTDRLYLVDDSGQVQCLRPIDSELPVVSAVMRDPAQPEESSDEKVDETKPADPAEPNDPFGADAADPFGAGGADPFGGGDTADPFGGAGDPFGGDPFGG